MSKPGINITPVKDSNPYKKDNRGPGHMNNANDKRSDTKSSPHGPPGSGSGNNRDRDRERDRTKNERDARDRSSTRVEKEKEPLGEKKFTGRCRLFVGNLTPDITEDDFRKMFQSYGEVSEVYVNSSRAFGFIRLDYRQNAEAAKAALDGMQRKGRILRVRFATHGAALKVRNLHPFVSNELLEQSFSQFGDLERCVVIVDDRGKSTGEGIVEFVRKPGANSAIRRINEGVFLMGLDPKPIAVEPLEQKDEEDGMPEKFLTKTEQYKKEREKEPRFAPPGTFEFEFGMRWKQLEELEKQRIEQVKKDTEEARLKLEDEMQNALYEFQAEQIRQDLVRQQEELRRLEELRNADRLRRQQEMEMRRQADDRDRAQQDERRRADMMMSMRQQEIARGRSGAMDGPGGMRSREEMMMAERFGDRMPDRMADRERMGDRMGQGSAGFNMWQDEKQRNEAMRGEANRGRDMRGSGAPPLQPPPQPPSNMNNNMDRPQQPNAPTSQAGPQNAKSSPKPLMQPGSGFNMGGNQAGNNTSSSNNNNNGPNPGNAGGDNASMEEQVSECENNAGANEDSSYKTAGSQRHTDALNRVHESNWKELQEDVAETPYLLDYCCTWPMDNAPDSSPESFMCSQSSDVEMRTNLATFPCRSKTNPECEAGSKSEEMETNTFNDGRIMCEKGVVIEDQSFVNNSGNVDKVCHEDDSHSSDKSDLGRSVHDACVSDSYTSFSDVMGDMENSTATKSPDFQESVSRTTDSHCLLIDSNFLEACSEHEPSQKEVGGLGETDDANGTKVVFNDREVSVSECCDASSPPISCQHDSHPQSSVSNPIPQCPSFSSTSSVIHPVCYTTLEAATNSHSSPAPHVNSSTAQPPPSLCGDHKVSSDCHEASATVGETKQTDMLSSYEQPTGTDTEDMMDTEVVPVSEHNADLAIVDGSAYQSYRDQSLCEQQVGTESQDNWQSVQEECHALDTCHINTSSDVNVLAVLPEDVTTGDDIGITDCSVTSPSAVEAEEETIDGVITTAGASASNQSTGTPILPSARSAGFLDASSFAGPAMMQGVNPAMMSSSSMHIAQHLGGATLMRHQAVSAGLGQATAVLQQHMISNGQTMLVQQRTMSTGIGGMAQQTVVQQQMVPGSVAAMHASAMRRQMMQQQQSIRLAQARHVVGNQVIRTQAIARPTILHRAGASRVLGPRLIQASPASQGSMMQRLVRQRYMGGPIMPGRGVQMMTGRPVRVKMTYQREVMTLDPNT